MTIFQLLYDIFVPRFVTENVAIFYTGPDEKDFEILCIEQDLNEFDSYDAIAKVKSFVFLGHGFFGRLTLPPR